MIKLSISLESLMQNHPVELISSLVPSPAVTFGLLEVSIAIAIVVYAGRFIVEKLTSEAKDDD